MPQNMIFTFVAGCGSGHVSAAFASPTALAQKSQPLSS